MKVSNSKRSDILKAAVAVSQEEGVSHLTLEQVARKAGVSKGGLLYHFPNKETLIRGMVEEWTNSHESNIKSIVNQDIETNGIWSRSYIKATFDFGDDNSQLNASLTAAMFINPELLEEFRNKYEAWNENLMQDGIDPAKATIARLATDGLWYSEMLGLSPLNPDLKRKVYEELMKIVKEGSE